MSVLMSPSRRPRVSGASSLLWLAAGALACATSAAREIEANALFFAGRSAAHYTVHEHVSVTTRVPGFEFPLDHTLSAPLDQIAGEWAYADEAGRVRAFAVTRDPPLPSAGQVTLTWEKRFRKETAGDVARFTLNRSWLYVLNDAPVQEQPPHAFLYMRVLTKTDRERTRYSPQFEHHARIDTVGVTPMLVSERTRLFGDLFYELNRERGIAEPESWKQVPSSERRDPGSAYYELGPYTGDIDLSEVGVGETYTVIYTLQVGVADDGHESTALGYLGDPLDVDSGFAIETSSTPLPTADVGHRCRGSDGDQRYSLSTDLQLAKDAYTGLQWQRCPLGYSLETSGTADPGDDRCEAQGDTRRSWQAALERSVAESTGGFADWRVPNVKELESLVELSCLAHAIDSVVFPPTPHLNVWSATPSPRDPTQAEVVNFVLGDVSGLERSALADVRLVRTADGRAAPPLPAVTLGTPRDVIEGNEGTRTLNFPLTLDVPAAADVTVEYETRDNTALADEDYTHSAGTVVIPAGTLAAEIQVAVLGDRIGEPNESLELVLTSVSANARLRVAGALGQIRDDEPVLSVLEAEVTEARDAILSFAAVLDRAADEPVRFTYEAVGHGATGGDDFITVRGEGVIPAGARFTTIAVHVLPDALVEGDEAVLMSMLQVTSHNARFAPMARRARGYILDANDVPWLTALNDTGILMCADADEGALTCPQPGFPGQDAEQGRDRTHADDRDGVAGMQLTKLDAAGAELTDQTADYGVRPWDCVRDEVTGLHWEVKTDDGGLRDKDWTYTWYDSSGVNDGGTPGWENGGQCVDAQNCDTQKYVAAVNAAGLCGFSDWRLPTREELLSIVTPDAVFTRAPYDPEYFPNTLTTNGYYWTSSPRPVLVDNELSGEMIWTVYWQRAQGATRERPKTSANPVRLVRGARP